MERKECLNADYVTFACVQPRLGKYRKGTFIIQSAQLWRFLTSE